MTGPSKTNNNVRIARRHLQSHLKNNWAYPPLPYEYECSGAPKAQDAPTAILHEDTDAVDCVSEAELSASVDDGRPIETWRERTFAESDPSSGDELPPELQGIESLYSNTAKLADVVQALGEDHQQSSSTDQKKDKRKRDLLFHSKAKRRSRHESEVQAPVDDNADQDDTIVLVNSAGTYQRRVRRGRDAIEARRRAARRQRRNERFRAEMEWNPGLAHWAARRDAWVGACKVKATPRSESDNSGQASRNSRDLNEEQTNGTATMTDETVLAEDAFAAPVRILLPVPTPLLTTDNPDPTLRVPVITPQLYPSIYSRLVIQSVSPSVPINLSHMISALVQGWKADGEWPAQPSKPTATPQHQLTLPNRRQKKQRIPGPAVASAVETLRATDQITKRALRSIGLGGSVSAANDTTLQPPQEATVNETAPFPGTLANQAPPKSAPLDGPATNERHHRRQQSSPGTFQKTAPQQQNPEPKTPNRAKAHSLSTPATDVQREPSTPHKRFVDILRPGTSGSASASSGKVPLNAGPGEDLIAKAKPAARPPTMIAEKVGEEEREAERDAVKESRDSGISGISEPGVHNKERADYREIDQIEGVDDRNGLTLREALLQDPEVLLDGAPSATFRTQSRDAGATNVGADPPKTPYSAPPVQAKPDTLAEYPEQDGTRRVRKKSSMDVVKSGIVKVVKTATGLAGSNAGNDGVDNTTVSEEQASAEGGGFSQTQINRITEEMEAFALPGADASPDFGGAEETQDQGTELCANASMVRGYSLSIQH